MAQKSIRAQRVGDEIKKILGNYIQKEITHPALDIATVVDVNLSNDLKYAKIYISIMGDSDKRNDGIEYLKRKTGMLRKELSKKLYIRFLPELRFYLDETLDNALRIEELIKKIHDDDRKGM